MTDPPTAKPSDLKVRVLSAIVMILIAGAVFWVGGWPFWVFVNAIGLGLLWEWWGLISKITSSHFGRFLWMIGGFFYIGTACFILNFLRIGIPYMAAAFDFHPRQSALCVAISMPILIVIATDVGAYFIGRTIGGPKIAPKISPSKTWSGLAGGMIGAAIVAGFSAWYVSAGIVFGVIASVTGAFLAIVAQTGDFFESWMKRRAGLKDSGRLIPGHGGLLDRMDGLLAVLIVSGVLLAGASLWVFGTNFTT